MISNRLTITGGSLHRKSRHKDVGGLYPFGRIPVNNQLEVPRVALAFQTIFLVFVLFRV